MSWPPEIQLFTLTFGPGTSMIKGSDLGMDVDLTASTSAVWAATGTPLISMMESASAEPGMQGSVTMPNPDQDGFIDSNGNTVKNWTIRAAVKYTLEGRTVATASKVFTVTADDTTVDLDTLIPVTGSSGVTIAIPDSWSTSVAAAEQAAVDAVAAASGKYAKPSGGIPKTDLAAAVGTSLGKADTVSDLVTSGRLSETALSDTIVAVGSESFVITLGRGSADDTAAINAALDRARAAGQGVVVGKPGESYSISAPLVVGSNTKLIMDGCSVTLKPGNQTNMVTNYSNVNPVAVASDAAVAIGSNVVTTSLASQAVIGQTLTVTDAGAEGNGPLIGIVSAKTSSTITLVKLDNETAANATATVSASAAVLSNRDADIKVLGGAWDRGANGPNSGQSGAGSGTIGHSFFLKHVDGLTVDIERASSTAGISFVWPTDVRNFRIAVRSADVVRTIVQVVGPARSGFVEYIEGSCNDDMLNICGNVYRDQTDTAGDVTNVTVGILIPRAVGGSALKLNAGAGCTLDGISVDRILGTTHFGSYVGDDSSQPATTGGHYGSIDLGHIDVVASGASLTLVTPDASRIRSRGRGTTTSSILFGGTNYATAKIGTFDASWDFEDIPSGNAIDIHAANIGHLILDKPNFAGNTAGVNLSMITGTNVAIETVTLRDARAKFSAQSGNAFGWSVPAGTVGCINIFGGSYSDGAAIVRGGAGITTLVRLANGRASTMNRIINMYGPTTLDIDNFQSVGHTATPIVTNGGSLLITGGGFRLSGSYLSAVQRASGTQPIQVQSLSIPVDVALLSPQKGDIINNTNGGTINPVGPIIYDGSVWNSLIQSWLYLQVVTLAGGQIVVPAAKTTANTRVRLSVHSPGGTVGTPYVSARTAGTSFTISSTSATDTSQILCEVIKW